MGGSGKTDRMNNWNDWRDAEGMAGGTDAASDGASADTLESLATQMRERPGTRRLGELGERYAALWLVRRGHRLLTRNWHTRYGELDVVTLSPDGLIVFVEVKTRRSMRNGTPQEAVTQDKQLHLRRAGVDWLLDPGHHMSHRGVRFDVITVVVRGPSPMVHHIPGAF